MVISPVTKKPNTIFKRSINCDDIIKSYLNHYDIDVRKYFSDLTSISIYECLDTGYRFFYPLNVDGDSKFYEKLQEIKWYYMPWRWEHSKAADFLNPNMSILEIGSGHGGFLQKIKHQVRDCVGLELNEQSVNIGNQKNLKILNQTIQDHSKYNKEAYDLICTFQVLEHIQEVNSFISAALTCLKIGGKFVICVPNNSSFIKYLDFDILNLPPHHMGLWNDKSLKELTNVFSMETDKLFYEPLQDYHIDWYKSIMEDKYLKNNFIKFFYRKMKLNKLASLCIKGLRHLIKGQSVMAVFTKVQ
ncbi:class I SAM-dependent methyltransferase [Spirosoma aerolatum]|uniref:class I SAM-dependent methyltransferase n=1 Tax=Spirosoma aerolatum TaxID=1211326 RepID=UPI0009AD7C9D|nr:class I SAM-dependent methyltransferase [Spirosoma aerolatum]